MGFTTYESFHQELLKQVPTGSYEIDLQRNQRTACLVLNKFTDKNLGHYILKGEFVKLIFRDNGFVDCYITKKGSRDIFIGGLPLHKLIT